MVLPVGTQDGTISVPVKGERKVEPDEQLKLTLSNPVGVVLGNRSALGTIVNDD